MAIILKAGDQRDVIRYERAKHRLIFQGGIYHVTQRAPGEELLFRERGDYARLVQLLRKACHVFQISLFCFSLLPNHLHLLLQIKEPNLSRAMKFLFESYAKFFNKKYKRKGHVFCGPFRAMVCDSDSYLLAASTYIHLNAFRAGLCEVFDNYRWHTLNHYLLTVAEDRLVESNFILSGLHKDRSRACQEYHDILQQYSQRPKAIAKTPRQIHRAVSSWSRQLRLSLQGKEQPGEAKNAPHLTNSSPGGHFERGLACLRRVEQLRENGCDETQIREELGLSKSSYYRWLKRADVPKLKEAGLKAGTKLPHYK